MFFQVPPCLFYCLKQRHASRVFKFTVQRTLLSLSPSLCLKVSRTSTDLLPEDADTALKMENKQSVCAAGAQDNLIMKPADQKPRTRGRNDIMTRRLKNRERQRRYRARKRLESENKKSSVIKVAPQPVKVELESNVSQNSSLTRRIYCKRDWKKEARRAHVVKVQQLTLNGSNPSQALAGEPEAECLPSGIGNKAEPALPDRKTLSSYLCGESNVEPPRVVLSRRDWKAEARKRKS